MTLTDIEALLIAALPALTSIITFLVATIKFIGKFTNTDTHIQENLKKLEEAKEVDDKRVTELKQTVTVLLEDNAKLKNNLQNFLHTSLKQNTRRSNDL